MFINVIARDISYPIPLRDLAGSAPLREDNTCMLRRQYGSREGAMCAEETQRDLLFYRLSPPWKGAAPTKRCSDWRRCFEGAGGEGCKKAARGGSLAQPGLLFVMSIFTVLSFYGFAVTRQGSEKNLVGLVAAYADVNAFAWIIHANTL